ncbi:hypothetical protein GQ472_00825 [archaeon]|nr:hypothetical protein [archaeon]
MGNGNTNTGFVEALDTKKGLQVAEEADFMCDCLEYYGIDLINGGTSADNILESLFDRRYCTPIDTSRSESVVDYALGHGMLIEVKDTKAKNHFPGHIKVGPSKKRYTYNSFWNTGIPAELLEYGNDKSIKKSSPRARIDEIKDMINLSYEDLDKLQEDYGKLIIGIENLHSEIATSGKPIANKLNGKGFYISSVEVETMANQIELVKKAKSVVGDYSNDKLQMILDLDPETFSDEFYDGKPRTGYDDVGVQMLSVLDSEQLSDESYDDKPNGGYTGGNLSQKDINAYKTHLKNQKAAEARKEFFKSAMNL